MCSDDKNITVKDVKRKPKEPKTANLELLKLVQQADEAGFSYGKYVEKNKV